MQPNLEIDLIEFHLIKFSFVFLFKFLLFCKTLKQIAINEVESVYTSNHQVALHYQIFRKSALPAEDDRQKSVIPLLPVRKVWDNVHLCIVCLD